MHANALRSGEVRNMPFISVLNALISIYVKCAYSPFVSSWSLMGVARGVFDEMPERDELSWTTMMTGYVKNDDLDSAHKFFGGMSNASGCGMECIDFRLRAS